MIFQELNRLKRNSIMSAVVLMAIGIIMVICPDPYITSLINLLGVIMLVAAVVMALEFISSKKALIHFLWLTLALILVIVGTLILIFEIDTLYAISWIFGIFLILYGLYCLLHALTFARRAERKAWWLLIPLSAALIVLGIIAIWNPRWETPGELLTTTGWMIVFAAIISVLRLIWIWPVKDV